ncbi:carbohydrate-binding module family 50 protein [Macrolepiota fuliginosa MF-IS2]|uniref:Carbohydrate-binding module family 50 protein n=1 Tax=Macrolepiota fuliginosa MF-IS2 TaxID=1400762 RepID=A0A9P5X8P1_9AGAR|nr:carbohydrate-binding module family 50 protein [Macrolepiota fuliginosa MF-IS2]
MLTSTLFAIVCAVITPVRGIPQSQSPGAACQAEEQAYTVQAGDTCFTIGRRLGVFPNTIIHANQPAINADCTNLLPDQMICIPASTVTTGSITGV